MAERLANTIGAMVLVTGLAACTPPSTPEVVDYVAMYYADGGKECVVLTAQYEIRFRPSMDGQCYGPTITRR